MRKKKNSTNRMNVTFTHTSIYIDVCVCECECAYIYSFILLYPTQLFSEKPRKAEITALDWIQLLPSLSVTI